MIQSYFRVKPGSQMQGDVTVQLCVESLGESRGGANGFQEYPPRPPAIIASRPAYSNACDILSVREAIGKRAIIARIPNYESEVSSITGGIRLDTGYMTECGEAPGSKGTTSNSLYEPSFLGCDFDVDECRCALP